MKISIASVFVLSVVLSAVALFTYAEKHDETGCLIGAFLADSPTRDDIFRFKSDYGKKPYIIMVFIEWRAFVKEDIIRDVYENESALMITWEPWAFKDKSGIDFDKLLAGGYDPYIKDFAARLKDIDGDVYLRFAHEPNGDWYPWSSAKIGNDKYIRMYRHVKDVVDAEGAKNVKWVFAVNWEDIPKDNSYKISYPGDEYADYIGIDGYNWGASQSWSRWMTFAEIFGERYEDITRVIKKPVMISEFGSSSSGGDKRLWIEEAMAGIKGLKGVAAFVIFNVDKETDWKLSPGSAAGAEFRIRLSDSYFKEL